MPRLLDILCVVAALVGVTMSQEEWGYGPSDGPDTWPENFPQCDGQRQSPINIKSRSTRIIEPSWHFDIYFVRYTRLSNGVFTNNGHTVNLVLSNSQAQVVITGDYPGTYKLLSLHFHWPSEHTIDGTRYQLELHMVHRDPNTNKTLVLGYLFDTGCSATQLRNSRATMGMERVARTVSEIDDFDESEDFNNFAPSSIMPDVYGCNYFSYSGSLTTPPCTENVTWLVYRTPLCILKDQLSAFLAARDAHGDRMAGNFRPVQALNGREVLYLPC